jgi:hypothetical protein
MSLGANRSSRAAAASAARRLVAGLPSGTQSELPPFLSATSPLHVADLHGQFCWSIF